MHGKLFLKVSKGEKRADRIKTFLVLPMTAFDLAVMSWGIRTDKFVPDTQLSGSFLEKCRDIPFAVGKTVGKLKSVVGLDTFGQMPFLAYHFTRRFRKSAEE